MSNSSQTIIDCLLQEAVKYNIEIRLHHEIKKIVRTVESTSFDIHFNNDLILHADFICLATGGYPKTSQFDWILQTGHSIEEPVPSLFTFNMPENSVTVLMGISVPQVQVKVSGTDLKEKGPLLITHWGMSGPAILKLSAWGARILREKDYQFEIRVNWLGGMNEQILRDEMLMLRESSGGKKIRQKNPWDLPQRLWEWLLEQCGIQDIHWADLPGTLQTKLIQHLTNQAFRVQGKTTFKEEFVTAGGVNLSEIHHHTMESRVIPGIFFAGEVLDVDGVTGGFNFQHAWSTGFIAGKSISGMTDDG